MDPPHILAIGDADKICVSIFDPGTVGLDQGELAWSRFPTLWLGSHPSETLARASTAAAAVVTFSPNNYGADHIYENVWLISQLGVTDLVVVVEAADVPPDGRRGFDRLTQNFHEYINRRCTFQRILFVPVEAKSGGNITRRAEGIGWYMGPTVADFLGETFATGPAIDNANRVSPTDSDHFQARLVWLDDTPLLPWRPYKLEISGKRVEGSVSAIRYEVDADVDERVARNRIFKGEVGVCNINTEARCRLIPFAVDRNAGTFLVHHPDDDRVVAFGLIDHSLRRATNVKWQATSITPRLRAERKQQDPTILWFTGISGAGKSTIADLVEKKLAAAGKHTMLLDGDNVRHGLNKDLGFTEADRVENVRRIAEVSKLMCDAGLIVMVSFISPFRAERQLARETAGEHGFCEIYVSTPLEVAEQRDVKGLYAKARRGEIKNFTAIDSPYEPPTNPEIVVDTNEETAEAASARIVSELFGL